MGGSSHQGRQLSHKDQQIGVISWTRLASEPCDVRLCARSYGRIDTGTQPALRTSRSEVAGDGSAFSLLTLALCPCSAASSGPDDLPFPLAPTSRVSTANGLATVGGGRKTLLTATHAAAARPPLNLMPATTRTDYWYSAEKVPAPSGLLVCQPSRLPSLRVSSGWPQLIENGWS